MVNIVSEEAVLMLREVLAFLKPKSFDLLQFQ